MKEQILALLAEKNITQCGFLPVESLTVYNPRLMPDGIKSAILLAVPYDLCLPFDDGVSAYAHICDYHRFFKDLFERLLPKLEECFPTHRFYGFADHSPIGEKDAAAKAGLGVIGRHSLLINPIYGSYVFLGSVLTDLEILCTAQEVHTCTSCGKCERACPVNAITNDGIHPDRCLSALSQKKNLSKEEMALLQKMKIAWGCDRCQEVCPQNAHRAPTEVPFFLEHRHGTFTADEVLAMDDVTFSRYAFSWRGRKRITENLQNLAAEQENSNNFT